MTELLTKYFNTDNLSEVDGRTMAAVFRRFDIVENYFKNDSWWTEHMKNYQRRQENE